MLFNYYSGDVFSSGAQVIVHQVNCMGVMGSGVARIVREKYPEVYLEYKKAVETLEGNCLGGCLLVGRIANLLVSIIIVVTRTNTLEMNSGNSRKWIIPGDQSDLLIMKLSIMD